MLVYLRRLALLGIPTCVGVLGIIHPIIDTNKAYSELLPQVNLWIILHILLLPLFFLLSLVIYLLIRNVQTRTALVCKVALVLFAIFYPANDSIIGIGGGLLVRATAELPSDQLLEFAKVVSTYFENPVAMSIGLIGQFGWQISLITAAIGLCKPYHPLWSAPVVGVGIFLFGFCALLSLVPAFIWWPGLFVMAIAFGFTVEHPLPGFLLIVAALSFGQAHIFPYGPLGMACLLGAALYFELSSQRTVEQAKLKELDGLI